MTMEVNFGFRFNRDPALHKAAIEVRERLAGRYARSVPSNNPLKKVEFYPVSRAGNSGSEVFYCDIYFEKQSVPRRHIAKFQSRKLTEEEYSAAIEARNAQMCADPTKILDDEEDLGMIVYDLAKAKDHREFRGLFLDPAIETEFCRKALSAALSTVGQVCNEDADRKPIYEDFRDYLERRRSNPIGKMKALAGATSGWESLGKPAADILRVLEMIEKQTDHLVHPYLVHGDLHARNLVIDATNARNTELIDFAWVHWGHPGKDLALMEASLKYMLLAELVQKRLGKTATLSFDAFCAFESYLIAHSFDLPEPAEFAAAIAGHLGNHDALGELMLRTYICIRQVREAAKAILGSYCETSGRKDAEHEYSISLFLITFGIFGIQETEQFWALAGLHCLAQHLEVK